MASPPRYQFEDGSRAQLTYKWVGIGLFVILLILVAFAFNDTGKITLFDNDYTISTPRLTKAIAFIVAILGLQVVVGFTGQLSLGQGFFFGTGAYISAWLVADHNWAWFSTLLVVIPVCFLLGMVFGIPALRVRGLYLALVTLGLAAVFPAIVQLEQFEPYTNGAGGKIVDSDLVAPSWLPLDGTANVLRSIPLIGDFFGEGDLTSSESDRIWSFFLMVVVTAICFKLVSNLIQSRPGRAMRAIRDNETSAAVSGMNLARYKTLSFGVASALGGVGGMIYVAELGIAAPLDFTLLISIFFLVGIVLGGVGTLSGAVIGGFAIAFIPDWAASTESLPGIPEPWLQGPTGPLIMGVLLIVLTFFMPGGIVAGTRQLKARFLQITPRPPVLRGATTDDAPEATAEPAVPPTTGEQDTDTTSDADVLR